MRNYLQRKLIRFIVKDIFNTIDKDDILRIKGEKWTWRGKEIDDNTIGNLKIQAKNFSESLLWKVLKAELQWQAVKTLLEKGKDSSDIRAAQLLGYLTIVIDEKLTTISDESLQGRRG